MSFDLEGRQPGMCPNCQCPCDEHGCHAPVPMQPNEDPTLTWGDTCGLCAHPDAIRLSGLFDNE